jgi:N-acetylglucosamine malate deacetylase 1
VAPHPDDETLGCGGSLLRHIADGEQTHWLVVCQPPHATGVDALIDTVGRAYGFAGVHCVRLPDARLDTLPLADIIARIGAAVQLIAPTIVYVPHPGDAHTDHRVVFDATMPCVKWFRYASVRRVLAYETPSETAFGLDPDRGAFRPNVYRDVTAQMDRKLEILRLYGPSEIGAHPFPRSVEGVRALATIRGAECGYAAAEAFMLLRDRS